MLLNKFSHVVAAIALSYLFLESHAIAGGFEPLRSMPFNNPTCVAFSPDGNLLVCGGPGKQKHGTLMVWEVKTGQLKRQIEMTTNVETITFSADGKLLAAWAGDDHNISLFDSTTWTSIRSFTAHGTNQSAATFAPGGQTIAILCGNREIVIFDITTGRIRRTLTGFSNTILCLSFSPNGKIVAAGGKAELCLWNPETGTLNRTILLPGADKAVFSVSFSPDGKTLAGGCNDGKIRMWDMPSGNLLREFEEGHSNNVFCVRFSPDGKVLASRSGRGFSSDRESIFMAMFYGAPFSLWDPKTGNLIAGNISGDICLMIYPYSVAFAPDSTLLAATGNSCVNIWEVRKLSAAQNTSVLSAGEPPAISASAAVPECVVGVAQAKLFADSQLTESKATVQGGTKVSVAGPVADVVEVTSPTGEKGWMRSCLLCSSAEFDRRQASQQVPKNVVCVTVDHEGVYHMSGSLHVENNEVAVQPGDAFWLDFDGAMKGKPFPIAGTKVAGDPSVLMLYQADRSFTRLPLDARGLRPVAGSAVSHPASDGDQGVLPSLSPTARAATQPSRSETRDEDTQLEPVQRQLRLTTNTGDTKLLTGYSVRTDSVFPEMIPQLPGTPKNELITLYLPGDVREFFPIDAIRKIQKRPEGGTDRDATITLWSGRQLRGRCFGQIEVQDDLGSTRFDLSSSSFRTIENTGPRHPATTARQSSDRNSTNRARAILTYRDYRFVVEDVAFSGKKLKKGFTGIGKYMDAFGREVSQDEKAVVRSFSYIRDGTSSEVSLDRIANCTIIPDSRYPLIFFTTRSGRSEYCRLFTGLLSSYLVGRTADGGVCVNIGEPAMSLETAGVPVRLDFDCNDDSTGATTGDTVVPLPLLQQSISESSISGKRLSIRNPNPFPVIFALRSDGKGLNGILQDDKGENYFYLPEGTYEVYFVYANAPKQVVRGKDLRIKDSNLAIEVPMGVGSVTPSDKVRLEPSSLSADKVPPQPLLLGDKAKELEAASRRKTQKLLPAFTYELAGANPVRVRNPNDFAVVAGIRAGQNGKDLNIPANGVDTVYIPNGRFDIYFIYSDKPDALFQGDGFTLNNNGVEIQIVKVVNGNYGIRQVK